MFQNRTIAMPQIGDVLTGLSLIMPALSDDEIKSLAKDLDAELPSQYCSLLRMTDGLELVGGTLWGKKKLIACNSQIRAELNGADDATKLLRKYVVLGESDAEYIVVKRKGKGNAADILYASNKYAMCVEELEKIALNIFDLIGVMKLEDGSIFDLFPD
jgi:SMI1 / KNR4 family (SUKH-1)